MKKGSYSSVEKYGFFVIKKIKPITKIEETIYRNLNCYGKTVLRYVKDIRGVGIKCADIYYASNQTVIEEYIKGDTIDKYINSDIDKNKKIDIIKRVLDMFKLSLVNDNLRIDWNLKNFIISKNSIILIDFIPCIYVDKLNTIKSGITRDLYELYKNLDIQLMGIIGYSIFPFLEYEKKEFEQIYKDIYNYADKIYKIDKSKKHIFVDRILLIDEYLTSDMSREDFVNKYKILSLSTKMKRNLELGE